MAASLSYLKSAIGRKKIVGFTGLGLSLFVFAHMLGNLLIFLGPEAYNSYGHELTSNKFIYIAEVGLLVLFFSHFCLALVLAMKNRCARPDKYAVSAGGEKATSFTSKTMWHQGVIILIFVVLHLITFKYGEVYEVEYGGRVVRDLFRLMEEVFADLTRVGFYVFALLVLGFHLSHGVSSAFRSLGVSHPRYLKKIERAAFVFAAVVTLGFISQPLYIYFCL